MKSNLIFLFCFLGFCSFSIRAEQVTMLECSVKVKVGASSKDSFNKDLLVKDEDDSFLVSIRDDKLNVVDDFEYEYRKYASSSDALGSSEVYGRYTISDVRYEGSYFDSMVTNSFRHYYKRSVTLNRLNGEFNDSWTFYIKDLKNNWLGKKTKSNLNDGYVTRVRDGFCKKMTKSRFF
jgi:hypothetical protein